MDLQEEFNRLNTEKFNGELEYYTIRRWRMSRCLGRVSYDDKIIKIRKSTKSKKRKLNTLLHEMVHAYLHQIDKSCGHTTEFWRMFKEKGGRITPMNKRLYKTAHRVAYERSK
jgi:hypothetical protein